MASATKAAESRSGGDGGVLLKGSHLKVKEASIDVVCTGVREGPKNFNSALILDIEETHGCVGFAMNKTNIRRMVELIDDDYDNWVGCTIQLDKVRTTNPQTRQPAWGLEIVAATAPRAKRVSKKPVIIDVPF
jgi:hypothetical protein